jgi:hypothetical protein
MKMKMKNTEKLLIEDEAPSASKVKLHIAKSDSPTPRQFRQSTYQVSFGTGPKIID